MFIKILSAIVDTNMDDTFVNENIILKIIIISNNKDLLSNFLNRKKSAKLINTRIIKLIDIILLTPK